MEVFYNLMDKRILQLKMHFPFFSQHLQQAASYTKFKFNGKFKNIIITVAFFNTVDFQNFEIE